MKPSWQMLLNVIEEKQMVPVSSLIGTLGLTLEKTKGTLTVLFEKARFSPEPRNDSTGKTVVYVHLPTYIASDVKNSKGDINYGGINTYNYAEINVAVAKCISDTFEGADVINIYPTVAE